MRTSMRMLTLCVVLAVTGATALAQPAGSGSAAGSVAAPAGSAAPTGSAGSAVPAAPTAPTEPAAGAPGPVAPATVDPATADKRKICAEAMNADPSFALAVVKTINEKTASQHVEAARRVAKNERHVILAYAAMWLVAAGFVLFLWRRQQHLKTEIANLRRDLDAAAKDGK